MDSSYITPFISSAQNVFETMVQLPVTVGKPERVSTGTPVFDVSAIIGMSGDVEGTVALTFPTATAERVVALLTGTELSIEHEDFADAVGELVNMISGGAKAQFEGKEVNISCPSVVIGAKHAVFSPKDMVKIVIPFTTDCGEFAVEVAFKMSAMAAVAG